MDYDKLITTLSEMLNNENIYTNGLTMVYEVDEKRHRQIDEELYIKTNGTIEGFEHQEDVEIEIGGILVKFVKKNL